MAVGSQLERYRVLSPLGSGGMASVFLAEDELLGRRVALKRLSPGLGGLVPVDTQPVSRLRREALVGASLNHPNLVAVYDVLEEAGDLVIVMEYVPGRTLAEALREGHRMPPREALPILQGVAAGLDALHRRGIVHRDVKPANVLLGDHGAVKLADLGIASSPDRTRITSAGAIMGSFRYMAPEQLRDAPATPAIDIYALAAVAYEMLSGRRARNEPNPLALAHAIATEPPPDLRQAWPAAPPPAAALLSRGMAREPAERPASAEALVRDLALALEPPPAPTPKPRPAAEWRRSSPPPLAAGPNRRRAWPVLLLLAGAAAVAVVVALASGAGGGGSSPAHRTAGSKPRLPARHRGAAPAAARAPAALVPAGAGVSSPAPATASSPTGAVESFYHLAAGHEYAAAWALADPAFRQQLGGYDSFQGGQSGERSITFNAARVVSQSASAATVAIQTTSVRTDGTQHCGGTVDLVAGAVSGWMLHQIHINCA